MSAGLCSSNDRQDATLADQLMGKDWGRMIGGVGLGIFWGTFPGCVWLDCVAVVMDKMLHRLITHG